MKAGSKLFGSMFLGLCAIVGCVGSVRAQVWQPIRVSLGPVRVVTTCGITYAEYTWVMGGCLKVDSIGPLIRNGSNFSFDLSFSSYGGGVVGGGFFYGYAVVLGALAPGDYTLTTTSYNVPVATNTFTVSTNATPTLQPIGFAADGSFQIQVNGADNVDYVLQCSTDFKRWTTLSTNGNVSGWYFGTDPCTLLLTDTFPVLPGSRYYRVILQPVIGSPNIGTGPGNDGQRN